MKKLFLFCVLVLVQQVYAFANSCNDLCKWTWGNMDYFGYGGILIWLILIIVLVFVAFFIIKSLVIVKYDITHKETPLDILKKRYARGEITKEEFEKIKKDLES